MTRRTADMMGLNVKHITIQMHGIVGQRTLGGTCWLLYSCGSDTIDFRFRFSAESPSLLSVAHMVSAECDTSLSAYIRLRPKVEFHFRSTSSLNSFCEHVTILINWMLL